MKMEKEVFILCNSPECLREISSGRYSDLQNKDLFTCNLAYNYFRTTGRHLNIFTDATPIIEFFTNQNWYNVFGTYKYGPIDFIYSQWELSTKGLSFEKHKNCNCIEILSPVNVPASSAIQALFYLNEVEDYDKIHLIGYTLNEWEGLEHVKELENKFEAFKRLLEKYTVTKIKDSVFLYQKIK